MNKISDEEMVGEVTLEEQIVLEEETGNFRKKQLV